MSTTLKPNLMTEDVNQSVRFYLDRLGFQFLAGYSIEGNTMSDEFFPDTQLDWAMLGRDDTQVMFESRSSLGDEYAPFGELPLGASATLYFEVDNLDQLQDGLGDGVERVLPERTTFYGMREVWIRDNNGYILVLAQKSADQQSA
jgi:catechol 2,3-dioxygenase-like lactoylglutathione lyase family enzyme